MVGSALNATRVAPLLCMTVIGIFSRPSSTAIEYLVYPAITRYFSPFGPCSSSHVIGFVMPRRRMSCANANRSAGATGTHRLFRSGSHRTSLGFALTNLPPRTWTSSPSGSDPSSVFSGGTSHSSLPFFFAM